MKIRMILSKGICVHMFNPFAMNCYYMFHIINKHNYKRYIGYYYGSYGDLEAIKSTLPLPVLGLIFRDEAIVNIMASFTTDIHMKEYIDTEAKRYLLNGVYNEGYNTIDLQDKAIINVTTGQPYNNASHAEKELGVSRNNIRLVLKGERKSAGGFKWMYYKDYIKVQ